MSEAVLVKLRPRPLIGFLTFLTLTGIGGVALVIWSPESYPLKIGLRLPWLFAASGVLLAVPSIWLGVILVARQFAFSTVSDSGLVSLPPSLLHQQFFWPASRQRSRVALDWDTASLQTWTGPLPTGVFSRGDLYWIRISDRHRTVESRLPIHSVVTDVEQRWNAILARLGNSP